MDIYVPGWPLPCQMSPSKELMTHGHWGSLVLRHLTNLAWIGSHPLDEKLARHTHERAPKTTPPRLVWFVLPSHNLHTHTCHWPWAPLRIHTNCAIVAFISQCLHGYHCVCSLLVEVKGDECVLVWHPFAKAIVKAWPCIHKPGVSHLQSSPWTLHVGPIVFEN